MGNLQRLQSAVTLVCAAGVLVSIYALRVEYRKEEDDDYEALCDISEHVSCTNVLSSRWGRGFGVVGLILGEDSILNQPNSLTGIAFYVLLSIINRVNNPKASQLLFILSAVSNIMSLYLAAILYFILYDFCIVCVTTYTINAVLLGLSWHKKRIIASPVKKEN